MVNIAKRMRGFQPLLQVRNGQGAAVLPPPPAPRLAAMTVRYNQKAWNVGMHGARLFAKDSLPRLKYHNPTLPITVESAARSQLDLTFESADRDSLASIPTATDQLLGGDDVFDEEWSQVQEAVQVTGDASAPTTSLPLASFTRRAILNLEAKKPDYIWRWFKTVTHCQEVVQSEDDTALENELNVFFEKAEVDRQLVKAGMDAMRKQKEELRRAKEAAERLTSDA